MKFSYISPTELEIQADARNGTRSVDYTITTGPNTAKLQTGYVLVLDFKEDAKGRKNTIASQ